jgi:hypothetical protein
MTFLFPSCLSLVFLFLSAAGFAQVTLRGKILNYDGKSFVSYTPPLDWMIPLGSRAWQRLQPKTNGVFNIRIDNAGMATCQAFTIQPPVADLACQLKPISTGNIF